MDDIFNPWYGFDNWHEQLMIGAGNTYQTVCSGDSGGPLVVSRDGRTVQVGVASFTQEDDDACAGAAGFAELAGPQLAWVASQVPSIMDRWGGCTTPTGAPGDPEVAYGSFVPGFQWDGPIAWRLWCEGPPPEVSVPDLRGDYLNEASAKLQAVGLGLGAVRSTVDRSCELINRVMSQSPARART